MDEVGYIVTEQLDHGHYRGIVRSEGLLSTEQSMCLLNMMQATEP